MSLVVFAFGVAMMAEGDVPWVVFGLQPGPSRSQPVSSLSVDSALLVLIVADMVARPFA